MRNIISVFTTVSSTAYQKSYSKFINRRRASLLPIGICVVAIGGLPPVAIADPLLERGSTEIQQPAVKAENATTRVKTSGAQETGVTTFKSNFDQNTPATDTSVAQAGVTNKGPARRGNGRRGQRSNFNASVFTGVNFDWMVGTRAFQIYNPTATGVNALDEEAETIGGRAGINMRYKIDEPPTGDGFDQIYFHGRGETSWGYSSSKFGRIQPGAGNFEIPGVGIVNNILVSGIDNVEARTELHALEFSLGMGMVYGFGPIGNLSPGALIFDGTVGNFGTIGNLGSPGISRDILKLILEAEFRYYYGERTDDLSFANSGVSNRYNSETDINRYGLRLHSRLSIPLGGGIRTKLGPFVGVNHGHFDTRTNLDRGGSLGSEKFDTNESGYEVGFNTNLVIPIGIMRLTTYFNYLYESAFPSIHYRQSFTDVMRHDFEGAHRYGAGFKLIVPLGGEFSPRGEIASDVRLKTDIVHIGALPSGLPVYSYKYIWSPETHVGVMAQEALQLFPHAVREVDGFLVVDYSKIR